MIYTMAEPPARPGSPHLPAGRNFASIPPLPPIEIPRPTFVSPKHDPNSALSALDSDSPAPSSARLSGESYVTAYTSPIPLTAMDKYKGEFPMAPSRILDPSIHSPGIRGLAKSMSVDSFIKEKRPEQPPIELDISTRSASPADSVATSMCTVGPSSQHRLSAGDSDIDHGRQQLGISSSAHSRPPSSPPTSKLPDIPHPHSLKGRPSASIRRTNSRRMNRVSSVGGRSFAPMAEDDQDSSPEDSDLEPLTSGRSPITQSRDNLRRQALGPKRTGSLPSSSALPTKLTIPNRNSRMTVSGSLTGSHSNITTKNLPIRGTYAPRTPTIHAPPLKNKLSMPASFEPTSPSQQSRMRSQSIGDKPTSGTPYDGNFLRADSSVEARQLQVPNAREVTFAVVGAAGCGKSTFIRKSLKQNGVSAGENFSLKMSDGDGLRSIEYIERRSYITALFDVPGAKERVEHPFNVTFLEISIESLLSDSGELRDKGWPDCLPPVDGVFVCYNASERQSFTHVRELLSGYESLSVPSMVLACKSDLEKRISPSEASVIIQRYAGLVEVSSQTDSGKKKMRRSLDLFIKMLEKAKSDPKDKDAGYRNPVSPDALHPPPSPWNVPVAQNKESIQSTTLRVMNNGQSPLSAENIQPTFPHMSNRSPQKNSLPRSAHAPGSSPPSPTRSRSLSDLLTESQRSAKAARMIMPNSISHDRASPEFGESHLPLDRNRTRSFADIAQEDNLVVKLSNASAESPPVLPETVVLSHKQCEDDLFDITPLASPPTEPVKSSEQSEQETFSDPELTKKEVVAQELETKMNFDQEPEPVFVMSAKSRQKDPPPNPYGTLDELLDKLFFVAVSGDDPSFVTHFFLTFRRFATPRSVLLAMQRRMLELSKDTQDVTMASYAQMRICNLLEQWMSDYPTDFASPGAPGALTALVKQVLRQSHTLYYGSDFLPFLERLPTLVDEDGAWALKVPDASLTLDDESDSSTSEDLDEAVTEALNAGEAMAASPEIEEPIDPSNSPSRATDPNTRQVGRERKSSMPLSAKLLLPRPSGSTVPLSQKDLLARLIKIANAIHNFDSDQIALEITRREQHLFLQIEPRDWIRHTMVSGKKDPQFDKVARLNSAYNHLHEWAVSIILCHDKIRQRAKQVEKLADVAIKLRNLNNYSGLRAIVTAINQSTYPGDEVMELFKQKSELHKKFLSSGILLRTSGSHQSYRLALRNTRGPCIPSMEVHTSDMRRAHEGNPDTKGDDPSKVHWAKFDMLGKFITAMSQYQSQCRGPNAHKFPEDPALGQLFDVPVMDYDMQQSRMYPPPDDGDYYSTPMPPSQISDHSNHNREANVIKRLFFWS